MRINPIRALMAATVAMVGCMQAGCAVTETAKPGVAVLLVDTDRVAGRVDERIYGHFLEEINHSVVDGLHAEQIRGMGFEGDDFTNYWKAFSEGGGKAEHIPVKFEQGERSVRFTGVGGTAGIRQGRIYVQNGKVYDGSAWIHQETGSLAMALRFKDSAGNLVATVQLPVTGTRWQEVPYKFTSNVTDPQCTVEVIATGTGITMVDFISLMTAEARANNKTRPDLFESLNALKPPFIRWPGGSYASIYKWKDGIGPAVKRKYNPNTFWGNYSDYYGFGTDEFMELCRRLGSEPMIVLAATSTDPAQLEYAMEWVHYLVDPVTTQWGRLRAENGHPEPYKVPYIQIDNEPMNHNLTPDQYAAIVNLYGPRIRAIAPNAKIVACGQKRSNDMNWTQKLIDIAGANFDIIGCHNYEYEPENYATGVRRIEDYLEKAAEYIRTSKYPKIQLTVLEYGACRNQDWRAGLHAAGSLMSYENLSPRVDMAAPALLMRNIEDNPEWRAWIYHDHVSWYPAGGYVAQKLFRDYYAPKRLAFTSGTFADIANRADFFDNISQMKPTDWTPNTVDAIATASEDGKRIIIKAINYSATPNTLLTRLQGSQAPAKATVTLKTVTAAPTAENSLANPNNIKPVDSTMPFTKDMAFNLAPYTVIVAEIKAE